MNVNIFSKKLNKDFNFKDIQGLEIKNGYIYIEFFGKTYEKEYDIEDLEIDIY